MIAWFLVLGPLIGCGSRVNDPVLTPLEPARLREATSQTTGVMNARYARDVVYTDGSECYVRTRGTISGDERPREVLACPSSMNDVAWNSCRHGEIFRDEEGQCSCFNMGRPEGLWFGLIPAPRGVLWPLLEASEVNLHQPLGSKSNPCPAPALIPDEVTSPPDDHIGILSPQSSRHGYVYRERDGSCIVDGPMLPGQGHLSGNWIHPLAVPCPDGFPESCVRGLIRRLSADGERSLGPLCTCTGVEGDPPRSRSQPMACD
jgi:hypothetical protein